jgi:NAD(P)-dependent dehydrogenase (short-subunit alcohol dehydrogenase family)
MGNTKSVAIITGASQGIGYATAIQLARDFSAIVLAARNADALREVANTVKTAGAEPLVCDLDLSKVESAETLVKTTLDRFGRINALLNIAGAVPQIDLFEMTDEQWRAGMELKLHGARRVTILAWNALKQSKGSVVFSHDGTAALLHREVGTGSQHERRRGYETISRKSTDQSLWAPRRDLRPACLHGVACSEMDDRCICSDGRRRD